MPRAASYFPSTTSRSVAGSVSKSSSVLPERGGGAQKDEERDEHIARGIAEVHAQIPLGDGSDDVPIHVLDHDACASVLVSPF